MACTHPFYPPSGGLSSLTAINDLNEARPRTPRRVGAEQVVLFHHVPFHSDARLDSLEAQSTAEAADATATQSP